MEYVLLNNGITLLFYPMPNTHSVTLGLYVKCGSAYEKCNYAGMTHFLEHLHFRRLGDLSQDEMYYEMESMGSTLRATTYRDFMKFTMKIIPDKIEECMQFFIKLFDNSKWTDDEFEKEKQIVINQILEKGNYITLEKEMRKVIFKNHALSKEIMGDIEVIEVLKKSDMQEYKKKVFSANNMLFCITGNIDTYEYASILKSVQNVYVSQTVITEKIDCPNVFQNRKPDILLKYVQDDNPLEVNLSFDIRYNEKSKDLLTILNCILGEGVGSRLQKIIREEKCYSADIISYIEWYEKFAVLHINFSIEKKKLYSCLKDIALILEEMKSAITKKDLSVTLPFYTSNKVFYEDDTEEMNFQLAYNKFILGNEYEGDVLENKDETIIELQNLSKKIFVKSNLCVVVVGNTKTITKKSIVEAFKHI